MALYTERMSEMLCLPAAGIHAVSSQATTLTAAIKMQNFRRFLFIVDVGVVGGSGTVDFKVRWSATSAGTYADVTGAAITQITASTAYAIVEVTSEQVLSANPTAAFLKGSLTTGTAASVCAVVVLADVARYEPAGPNFNDATVAAPIVV